MRTFVKPINHHNKNRENYWLKTLVQDYKCFKSMKKSFDFACSIAENLKPLIKDLDREIYLNRSLFGTKIIAQWLVIWNPRAIMFLCPLIRR